MRVPLAVLLCASTLFAPCASQAQSSVSKRDYMAPPLEFISLARLAKKYTPKGVDTDSQAQYLRAVALEAGEGIERDLAQAESLYRKAALRGHVEAMLALGQMCQAGRGVAQDDAEAALWYRRAAEAGSPPAQYNLALMLATGSGVAQDHVQAAAWYERAAQHGFAKAQFNLAVMRANGQGGAADAEQAYKWFTLAAADGNTLAQKNLAVLASGMSAEQLARAGAAARDWQPVRSN
jgi:TPR repeat protein